MQLPTRFEFDALVLSSQIPLDDPHHLLKMSRLGATVEPHCYPDDSELFQGKAKFACRNEEQVILISPTHPLFDGSHHFVQRMLLKTPQIVILDLTATRKVLLTISDAPTTGPTTEEPSKTYLCRAKHLSFPPEIELLPPTLKTTASP